MLTKLKVLMLQNNRIGDEGVLALAAAVRQKDETMPELYNIALKGQDSHISQHARAMLDEACKAVKIDVQGMW